MRTRLVLGLAAGLVFAPTCVAAEPLHLQTPSTIETDGGTSLRLPSGYFMDESTWSRLDTEMRRLQDAETRLTAENESLRESANEIGFGWYALGAALVVGFAGGLYVGLR